MRDGISPDRLSLRARRRRGCMGCMVSLVGSLALFVVLGAIFLVAVNALFNPWAFYLGGRFHAFPQWQGWGRMHSKAAGGDYMLFVRMMPTPTGPPYLTKSLKGDAMVCTPKGERFHLTLGGSMAKHLPLNTVGQPVHLYMYNRSGLRSLTTDRRPELDLRGVWTEGGMTMEDGGSMVRAFLPDGSVRQGKAAGLWGAEKVAVTIAETSPLDVWPTCPAK
jgi:hypothetical protein